MLYAIDISNVAMVDRLQKKNWGIYLNIKSTDKKNRGSWISKCAIFWFKNMYIFSKISYFKSYEKYHNWLNIESDVGDLR